MKHFCMYILTCGLIGSIADVSHAQVRTVSKDGTKDHTSVQAAIGFFAGDVNPAPNVIQITDSEMYEEVITVDVPVTIEGTAVTKPRLVLQANPNGRAGSAGLVVKLPQTVTTGSVVLRNLTLLPSTAPAETPASSAIHIANNNAFVFCDGLLVTTNDGFNQPISTTGLVNITTESTHVSFGDDGIVGGSDKEGQFEGEGLEVLLRNTVITHLRGTTTGTCTAVLFEKTTSTVNRRLNIADGCVFSFNNGKALEVDGDFDLNASNQRAIITGNSLIALHFNGESPNVRRIKGALIALNSQVGLYESTNDGLRSTIENSIIANNTMQGCRISGTATTTLTIKNSTIGDSSNIGYDSIRVDGSPTDVVVDNSIICGSGAIHRSNRIYNLADGTYTFVNSALVSGGPQMINIPLTNITKLVSEPSVLVDPRFANVTDITSPDFYAVQSQEYANKGTAGSPLAGGGIYTGPAALPAPTDVVVTVAKLPTAADFTTIQSALDSLVLDPSKRYIVQVLDNSVYDEVITMNVPATIIGTGLNRPVLAVRENPLGFDNDGALATPHATNWDGYAGLLINIPVSTTTCTIGLKNLILIPSKVGTPPYAGLANKANNFYLEMENVLVTGNDGNDAPVAIDGLTEITENTSDDVHFRVSGGHLGSTTNDRPEGDGIDVLMRNCIFTNIRATAGDSWRSGLYMNRVNYNSPYVAGDDRRATAFRMLTIDEKCLFTYNLGSGLRSAGALKLLTPNNPTMFVGNQYTGLWLDTEKGRNQVNGVIVAMNKTQGLNEGVGNEGPRAYIKNAVVAQNVSYGLYHRLGRIDQYPTQLVNVTLANNSAIHRQMQLSTTSSGTTVPVETHDTILAGIGVESASNVVELQYAALLRIFSTAAVTAGPFALNAVPITDFPVDAPNATLVGTPVTGADPGFLNTTDPFAPNYYAVSNTVYGTLASDGTALRGGGNYVPQASVGEWTLY